MKTSHDTHGVRDTGNSRNARVTTYATTNRTIAFLLITCMLIPQIALAQTQVTQSQKTPVKKVQVQKAPAKKVPAKKTQVKKATVKKAPTKLSTAKPATPRMSASVIVSENNPGRVKMLMNEAKYTFTETDQTENAKKMKTATAIKSITKLQLTPGEKIYMTIIDLKDENQRNTVMEEMGKEWEILRNFDTSTYTEWLSYDEKEVLLFLNYPKTDMKIPGDIRETFRSLVRAAEIEKAKMPPQFTIPVNPPIIPVAPVKSMKPPF